MRSMTKPGPKSDKAKAAVRLNAVRHGLRAAAPVVRRVERVEDWKAHVESVVAASSPRATSKPNWPLASPRSSGGYAESPYEAEAISLSLDDMPDEYVALARYGEKVTGIPAAEQITPRKSTCRSAFACSRRRDARQIMRYEATCTASSPRPCTSWKPGKSAVTAANHPRPP
jgi:hypothetical protein